MSQLTPFAPNATFIAFIAHCDVHTLLDHGATHQPEFQVPSSTSTYYVPLRLISSYSYSPENMLDMAYLPRVFPVLYCGVVSKDPHITRASLDVEAEKA